MLVKMLEVQLLVEIEVFVEKQRRNSRASSSGHSFPTFSSLCKQESRVFTDGDSFNSLYHYIHGNMENMKFEIDTEETANIHISHRCDTDQ